MKTEKQIKTWAIGPDFGFCRSQGPSAQPQSYYIVYYGTFWTRLGHLVYENTAAHRILWIRNRKRNRKPNGGIFILESHLNVEKMVLTIEERMAWLLWDYSLAAWFRSWSGALKMTPGLGWYGWVWK